MENLKVHLKLDRICCHHEADAPGTAAPSVWTFFFKVDGETVKLNSTTLRLEGTPTIVARAGNPDTPSSTGEDLLIPPSIGEFDTTLKPIPFTEPIFTNRSEIGGQIGCLVLLMEKDNTIQHQAFYNVVSRKLDDFLSELCIETEEDLDELSVEGIGSGLRIQLASAILVFDWPQTGTEESESFASLDDKIGSQFVFGHDELGNLPGGTKSFSYRWVQDGDWEMFGLIEARVESGAGG